MGFQQSSISQSTMLVFFIFIGGVAPIEALKCISCTFAPGISGNKDGCNLQDIMMEKFLRDCSNVTKEATKGKDENNTENAEIVPTTSDLIGKMYCYTFTSQLNGKWLTERGCGASKVTEDLHNTCENVTDKNSSALTLTGAKICYCNDLDGCNNEISIRNITELSSSQNSTFSINGTNADRQNNRNRTNSTRNTFNSLTYHTRIQIVPNYQNPFDMLRRRNSTDNVNGQSSRNAVPSIASTNASTPTTTAINKDNVTLLANKLKTSSNVTTNGTSSDKIVQNGTIERKNDPINSETTVTENVIKSDSGATIASTPENGPNNASLNNSSIHLESPVQIEISTDASENSAEKSSTDKDCDSQSSGKSSVNLLRPYSMMIDVFAFISVVGVVIFSP